MSCKDLCPVLGEDASEEHIVSCQETLHVHMYTVVDVRI